MDTQRENPVEAFASTDLSTYWQGLRERWWIIVVAVVVAMGLGLLYLTIKTPVYRATSAIVREQTSLETVLFGSRLVDDPNVLRGLQTSADLVTSEGVAVLVKQDLGSDRSIGELSSMIQAIPPEPDSGSYTIMISAVSGSAAEAAEVANSFARQFVVYREEADLELITSARQVLQRQLDSMSATDLASGGGAALSQRLEELKLLEDFHTPGFVVSQVAARPNSAFSPRPAQTLIVGALMGIVLGLVLVFVLGYFDRRIKDEQTMEWEFGAPVLASPPLVGRRWAVSGNDASRGAVGFDGREVSLEAFRALRSNLHYMGLGTDQLRVLLVTSALPREGKTTTAINLALSLALAGEKVVLVEADLRKPTVHRYLGIPNGAGLSNVLSGGLPPTAALQKVSLTTFAPKVRVQAAAENSAAPGELHAGLSCLPAGPLPSNPAELLGSEKMGQALAQLRSVAGYIVIDSPPLLVVSDAVSLIQYTDGVLLTARVGGTTLEEARSVRSQLDRVGARVLGVVAAGGPARRRYRKYGYYAAGS